MEPVVEAPVAVEPVISVEADAVEEVPLDDSEELLNIEEVPLDDLEEAPAPAPAPAPADLFEPIPDPPQEEAPVVPKPKTLRKFTLKKPGT